MDNFLQSVYELISSDICVGGYIDHNNEDDKSNDHHHHHHYSFIRLSNLITEKREFLSSIIDQREHDKIDQLVKSIHNQTIHFNELRELHRNTSLLNVWFIIFKIYYPIELYRLYEMNLFIHSITLLRPTPLKWFDQCITSIYREILSTKLDKTIFYNEDYVDNTFIKYNRDDDDGSVGQQCMKESYIDCYRSGILTVE